MSDAKTDKPDSKPSLKGCRIAVCAGIAIGVANNGLRMLMRPDLAIGILGNLVVVVGWIVIAHFVNALIRR